MSVNLTIKMTPSGRQFPVSVELTATIAELKEQIATTAELPKENIRLVCAGKIWQDVSTLGSYQPADGATVHCLNNPPKAAAPPAAEQTLAPVNPMQSMFGGAAASGLAQSGGSLGSMVQQTQQMMAQNPEMMQQMMNSPMMQQLMSNPEMMRSIMRMNPQLNQVMEERPELARMLEDPEVLQQSMNMMRNPSLMREMQRNQDRAMGHLDVMPGGHNALVRAHEDMVDPLMSALSGSNQEGASNVAAYSSQTEGNPNNEALPNPWGAPAPAPAAAPTSTPAAATPTAPVSPFPTFGAQPQGTGAAPNPMASMMEQMMSNPAMMQQSMQMASQMFGNQQGGAAGFPGMFGAPQPATPAAATEGDSPAAGAQTQTPPADPMAAMMQQMMSNPAMMQQSMQMASMFGQQGANPALPTPAVPALPAQTPQADPFSAMRQQMMTNMMSNPAAMQGAMQMVQQMMGNQQPGGAAGYAGMFGAPPAAAAPGDAQTPSTDAAATNTGAPTADMEAFARARFAAQLAQLSAMGFCNEAACLRALQQHQGRVDAAIDALLASGES